MVFLQADLKRREQIAAGRARPGRQQGAIADGACASGSVSQIPPSVTATLGPPLGLPRTAAVQVSTQQVYVLFAACRDRDSTGAWSFPLLL